MEDEKLIGRFLVEIHQSSDVSCTRYCSEVDVGTNLEFKGVFWVLGGLGAFEYFSAHIVKEGEVHKVNVYSGEQVICHSVACLRQIKSMARESVFEGDEVSGGKIKLIMRKA